MQRRIYIETSVLSYYMGRGSHDVVLAGRQQATKEFWSLLGDELVPFVSALVLKEASQGDPIPARNRLDAIRTFAVLPTTSEAERLAQRILDGQGVPREYPEDALHVAIAVVAGMDCLVTWNFAHINNPFTKMMVRQAIENEGYECPEIVSPDAFLGEDR